MSSMWQESGLKNLWINRFSCKIFFMRATTLGALAKCQNNGECLIDGIGGKIKCIACRYAKCLDAGMNPENTARRKGCQLREKRAQVGLRPRGRPKIENLLNCLKPSTSAQPAPDSRELQLQAVCFTKPLVFQGCDSAKIIRNLINLNNLILNDDPSQSVVIDFPFSLDVPIMNVLRNPTSICPRVPIGVNSSSNPLIPANCESNMLARAFIRFMVLNADWLRGIPEFFDLDEGDQLTFFARNVSGFAQFHDYYSTYKMNFDEGIITVFGMRVKRDDLLHFQESKETYYYHIYCGMEIVIPCMKRAQMRDEEYVLMKNIILFSSDIGYKESSAEIIRKAFKKYTNLLLEHLKERYKDENEVISKFNDLMMIPGCMQNLAVKMNVQYSTTVLTNQGGVRGTLSEEIFWRL